MGVNSSHLGSGANVQTYVGNTSVDNAIIKSNDNNNDCWLMNWGDAAIWGIYNRNIDTTLTVAGAVDVKANSTAFIGGGLAKINLCHSDGSSNFNGDMILSGTGSLTLPKGTTAQRPSSPLSGMMRFNTSVGLAEVYTGTDWIYMSALNGSSAETAAPSASVIKALNPAAPNGVYWLKFVSGSNTAFQAYIIFDKPDGPWVKAVQWYNTTDLSGAGGVNAGGSWTSSQIGLSAGKIPSADINILKSSFTTLWRVTGSADPLMNYGAGALKIIFSSLPNWGTDNQPTTSQPYDIYVDAANDGTWDYGYRYVPTQQSRCDHTTSIWISDHNSPVGSGSTLLLGTKTSSAGYPICWTVGATSWYTNLHPWTGNSAASGGSIQWGSSSTAASLYFKN